MDKKTYEEIVKHDGYDVCDHGNLRRRCDECKFDVPAFMRKNDAAKSAGIAAVLSWFVPGLGHIYLGKLRRGFLWFFAVIVGLLFFIVPGIVIWIANIVDAYNQAK